MTRTQSVGGEARRLRLHQAPGCGDSLRRIATSAVIRGERCDLGDTRTTHDICNVSDAEQAGGAVEITRLVVVPATEYTWAFMDVTVTLNSGAELTLPITVDSGTSLDGHVRWLVQSADLTVRQALRVEAGPEVS